MTQAEQTQAILNCLTTAFEADPGAIFALMTNRVPTNQAMIDHPHMVCDEAYVVSKPPTLSALGLLNGVLSAAGLPVVAAKWELNEAKPNEPQRFQGFCAFNIPVDWSKADVALLAQAKTIHAAMREKYPDLLPMEAALGFYEGPLNNTLRSLIRTLDDEYQQHRKK